MVEGIFGTGSGTGALSDSGNDNADGGDIHQLPQGEDSIDLQGTGDIENAASITTDDLLVTPQAKPAGGKENDNAAEVVGTDANRGIAIWTTEDTDQAEGAPGRRAGMVGLMPDGQEIGRLTWDAVDFELSLYMSDTAKGGSTDTAGPESKVLNISAGVEDTDRSIDLKNVKNIFLTPFDRVQVDSTTDNAGAGDSKLSLGPMETYGTHDAIIEFKDDTNGDAYHVRYDTSAGAGHGRLEIEDRVNNQIVLQYKPGPADLELLGDTFILKGTTETADGMTADPETGSEDAYATVNIGGNTYQIPMYSA